MGRNYRIALIFCAATICCLLGWNEEANASEVFQCEASWYGPGFYLQDTASGEPYAGEGDFTTAHRTLPLDSLLYVENLDSGAWAILRVNDRGPYANMGERCLDVSQPWLVDDSLAWVWIEVIYYGES